MTKRVMHRLAKIVRSGSKTCLAVFEGVGSAYVKVGLVAAALFILAYAIETKAILALESSPELFGSHALTTVGAMYR
jgi:hypothetical protein